MISQLIHINFRDDDYDDDDDDDGRGIDDWWRLQDNIDEWEREREDEKWEGYDEVETQSNWKIGFD